MIVQHPSDPNQSIRHIPLEGQPNFRDLFGYRTASGRAVKPGLVYRSGELSELSDADLKTLQDLGIRTVVDFRSELEVKARGEDRLPTGATYLPLWIHPKDISTLVSALQTGDASLFSDSLLADANREMIAMDNRQYASLLATISDENNLPLVFHCTHGKDRTGWAAALILMVLGVSAAECQSDYLLSNVFRKEQNELQLNRLHQRFASQHGEETADANIAKLERFFNLQSSDFAAFLDEIEQRYGTFDGYLMNGLNVTSSDRDRLMNHLT